MQLCKREKKSDDKRASLRGRGQENKRLEQISVQRLQQVYRPSNRMDKTNAGRAIISGKKMGQT